jgi:glycosyltransferase involved in cell wall biosynthesis
MNIGIVTTWFERGAAYVSRQYCQALERNHQVFIYARGEKFAVSDSEWDKKNVTWGKRSTLPVSGAMNLADFKKWLKDKSIDVVFFNEQRWWKPVLLCKELGIKTGAYIDYYTEETVPFFGVYDFLICNTKRHFSVFEWHPQVYYVPWGTDIDLYKPESLSLVTEGHVTFFHSCGFAPERKGTDLVIRAFSKLNSEAKLLIHSQVDIRCEFLAIKTLIDNLELKGRLKIITDTVSAPGLYSKGDVYVYPSRLDGIGLTTAEALASGLPIIVSNNGPMNEFVTSESGMTVQIEKLYSKWNGYYWPKCDVDVNDLARVMQYYVEQSNDIEKLKIKARKFAVNNLDWKSNSSCISSIFCHSKHVESNEISSCMRLVRSFDDKQLFLGWRSEKVYTILSFLSAKSRRLLT